MGLDLDGMSVPAYRKKECYSATRPKTTGFGQPATVQKGVSPPMSPTVPFGYNSRSDRRRNYFQVPENHFDFEVTFNVCCTPITDATIWSKWCLSGCWVSWLHQKSLEGQTLPYLYNLQHCHLVICRFIILLPVRSFIKRSQTQGAH